MKYPICPECGKNTVVLFSPPKDPPDFSLIGKQEYVDWYKAHLYCCNAETDCKFQPLLTDLVTPQTESKQNLSHVDRLEKELAEQEERIQEIEEIGLEQTQITRKTIEHNLELDAKLVEWVGLAEKLADYCKGWSTFSNGEPAAKELLKEHDALIAKYSSLNKT